MTLFSAGLVVFKLPWAQALPTPFALTVVIALSLTSASGDRHAAVSRAIPETGVETPHKNLANSLWSPLSFHLTLVPR